MARRRALLGMLAGCSVAKLARAGSYDDFFLGIALDRPGIVAPLLARGFDVNARSPEGQHGLYLAFRENADAVAELLLGRPDLDPNAGNAAGETLLMMAALRGRLAAMRQLITRGARVDKDGWTPLHYAASGSEPQAVALLLDQGAEIDARAPNGNTPLMMAAGFGSIDAADLLARRGADVTLQNKSGSRASDFARHADRDELAQRLDTLAAKRGR
ncbi:MAG TPA: ankyrin repeat domain-containing protein [Ideonella sp.]|nr:ankyrin repeat domain-containing protein [Ideonella sp.]